MASRTASPSLRIALAGGALALLAAGATALAAPSATGNSDHPAGAGPVSRPESVFADGPGATTVAGTGVPGPPVDGARAVSAELDSPGGIAVDAAGDLFVADSDNCRVEEIPATSGVRFSLSMDAGRIYTIAGGACASAAGRSVGFVSSVALDTSGDVFIAGGTSNRVLELVSGTRAGVLRQVAGNGEPGSSGDGGPAGSAELEDPEGIGLDANGDLYIADTENCEVREVPSHGGTQWGIAMSAGDIYTIAGTRGCGQGGVGGPASRAQLFDPTDVATGPSGALLVSDAGGSEVLCLATRSGSYYGTRIEAGHLGVVAGTGMYAPYLVDGLPATGQTAELNSPSQIATDPAGDLFVADTYSSVIREVPVAGSTLHARPVSAGSMYTVAGAQMTGNGDQDTSWVGPEMLYPSGIAWGPGGILYFADQGADVVRKLSGS